MLEAPEETLNLQALLDTSDERRPSARRLAEHVPGFTFHLAG